MTDNLRREEQDNGDGDGSAGQEAGLPLAAPFPEADSSWNEDDWERLVDSLVHQGLVNRREVAAAILGHLNPPQVGTAIASKSANSRFQENYYGAGNPARSFWRSVRAWLYQQSGRCVDCGTRIDLQADHVETRQELGHVADRLDNLTLRCRRHNVARRPSHTRAGITFLTTESALMWLLFVKRPGTYQEFERLCREYGLSMADIRFQEAWAMARWLQREGLYEIDASSSL